MERELTQVPVELVDSSANDGSVRPSGAGFGATSGRPPADERRRWWYAALAVGAVVATTVLIVRMTVPDSPMTLPTTAPSTTTGDDPEAPLGLPPAAPGESVRVALDSTMKNLGAELVVLAAGGELVRIDPATGEARTIADIDREDSATPTVRIDTSDPGDGSSARGESRTDTEEFRVEAQDRAPPTLWPTSGMWVVIGESGRTKTVSPTGDVIALSTAAGPAITWADQYFDPVLGDTGVETRFMFAMEYEYRPEESAVLGYSRRTRRAYGAAPSESTPATDAPTSSVDGQDDAASPYVFVVSVMSPGPMSPWVACSTPSGVYVIDRDGARQVDSTGDLLAVSATQVIVSDSQRRELRIYDAHTDELVGVAGLGYAGPWPRRAWVARGDALMAAVTSAGMIFYDLDADQMLDIDAVPLVDPARVTVSWDETGRFASWLDDGLITVVDTAEKTVFRSTINVASASWQLQSVATLAKS